VSRGGVTPDGRPRHSQLDGEGTGQFSASKGLGAHPYFPIHVARNAKMAGPAPARVVPNPSISGAGWTSVASAPTCRSAKKPARESRRVTPLK
jgi:hypothetical protein